MSSRDLDINDSDDSWILLTNRRAGNDRQFAMILVFGSDHSLTPVKVQYTTNMIQDSIRRAQGV